MHFKQNIRKPQKREVKLSEESFARSIIQTFGPVSVVFKFTCLRFQ